MNIGVTEAMMTSVVNVATKLEKSLQVETLILKHLRLQNKSQLREMLSLLVEYVNVQRI